MMKTWILDQNWRLQLRPQPQEQMVTNHILLLLPKALIHANFGPTTQVAQLIIFWPVLSSQRAGYYTIKSVL